MNREIERKFLVRELPEDLQQYPSTEIIQGYLAITEDGTEVRIRKKGDSYFQTIKSGSGLERNEVEIEITHTQFEDLWLMTEGRRLEKIRYEIDYSGIKVELDIYRGLLKGLIVAEVEFPSIEHATSFAPPIWFGEEVTEDERYKNRNLVRFGTPNLGKPKPNR